MIFNNRRFVQVFLIAFFLGLFFLSSHVFEYDIWFHLKSGEIIAKEGIIFHDVFSQAAPHREWYPYEWLYQVGVYGIQELFGLASVGWVSAAVATTLLIVLFLFLRYIFALPIALIALVTFSCFTLVYDFLTPRPQVPAAILFLTVLMCIFTYLIKKRNVLWCTVPITLLWANMHASVVLAPLLFVGYAIASLFMALATHQAEYKKRAITLVRWALITAVLTVLPPLGTTQYRLLSLFWKNRLIITGFIDEWLPLNMLPVDIVPFILASMFTGLPLVLLLIRKLKRRDLVWFLPLLPLPVVALIAVRNLLWAYIALAIVFAWSMGELVKRSQFRRVVWTLCILMFILSVWLLWQKKQPERIYVPDNAVQFLKTYHLNGNMFNGIGTGGYLLYHLHPTYRVFIDGRADVYLCCEIPDMVAFLSQKNLPNDAWKLELNKLFRKHDISFILHTTKRNTVSRRIGELLQKDPEWSLVYWGDDFQILVKRDGKNDALIEEFGVQAATPLERTPFKEGQEDVAFAEYERMIAIADSARSRNAIGIILMKRGEFDEAKTQLERAIVIEPLFDSPYMNLGELAVRANNLEQAIRLYNKALTLEPSRGFTYIRLGQLYRESGDTVRARNVWRQGLSADIPEESKKQLQSLIDT